MFKVCNEKTCLTDMPGDYEYCGVHFPLYQARPILFLLEKHMEPLPRPDDPKDLAFLLKMNQIELVCRYIGNVIKCMKLPEPQLLVKLENYSSLLKAMKGSFNSQMGQIFTDREDSDRNLRIKGNADGAGLCREKEEEKERCFVVTKVKRTNSCELSTELVPDLKIRRRKKLRLRSERRKSKFTFAFKFPKKRRKKVKRVFPEKVVAEDDERERVCFQGRSYVNYGMKYFKCEFRGCIGRIKKLENDQYEVYKGHSSKCHLSFRRKSGKGPVYKRTKREKYLEKLSQINRNEFSENTSNNLLI